MRTSSRPATFLFVSAILLSGCNKGPKDGVVATVNGHPIQQTELDKAYNAQIAGSPQGAPAADQAQSLKLNLLRELVNAQIVEQRAAKQGLTATNDEIDAKFNEMKASYTEEEFNKRLQASNLTLDEVKHDIRRSLTQNKLLNKEINSKITVSDSDISGYYNAHKAEFNLPDNEYHLAQIIVSSTAAPEGGSNNLQNSKANGPADAKKKIQAIKNRLDAGDDFGTLAVNFSENAKTAANRGDMGLIAEQDLKTSPDVFTAVNKLHAGQYTDIMPFPDAAHVQGYAVFQLIEKAAAGQRELGDPRVHEQIRRQLQDSRSQLLKAAYLEMLTDQSKVENYLAEQIFKDSAK